MDHKNGIWARQILDSRNEEGMWGTFHTLSRPASNRAITTEQVIRRLRILGFTKRKQEYRIVDYTERINNIRRRLVLG